MRGALAPPPPAWNHAPMKAIAILLVMAAGAFAQGTRADYDRAEKWYLEAIETLRAQEGEHAEAIIDNYAGLAELYFQTGQYQQAEPILRQVLDERRQILGLRDPAVADAMEELGLNMLDQGRYAEAEQLVREALELRIEVLGSEPHPDISENLTNLGMVEDMLGRYDETKKLYQQALAMDRARFARAASESRAAPGSSSGILSRNP